MKVDDKVKQGDKVQVKLGSGALLDCIYQNPSDMPGFHWVTCGVKPIKVHENQIKLPSKDATPPTTP